MNANRIDDLPAGRDRRAEVNANSGWLPHQVYSVYVQYTGCKRKPAGTLYEGTGVTGAAQMRGTVSVPDRVARRPVAGYAQLVDELNSEWTPR
jgi:hypothetical protein